MRTSPIDTFVRVTGSVLVPNHEAWTLCDRVRLDCHRLVGSTECTWAVSRLPDMQPRMDGRSDFPGQALAAGRAAAVLVLKDLIWEDGVRARRTPPGPSTSSELTPETSVVKVPVRRRKR